MSTFSKDIKQIKNIEKTIWFRTINYYPKTMDDIKLLFMIVDKINIFHEYDLSMISEMNEKSLDIIYAILRITNKIFTKYSEHVVKKIFVNKFKKLLIEKYNVTKNLSFLMDQMIQDFEHFVSIIVKKYRIFTQDTIKYELTKYIKNTFSNRFYKNCIKKLSSNIETDFYLKHDLIIDQITKDFISYTEENITSIYITMRFLLDNIFSNHNNVDQMDEIKNTLNKYINLDELFMENCMELDIYGDEKFNDDIIEDEMTKNKINNKTRKMKYEILDI